MAEKIGVYICEGCDIGKSIDVEAVTEAVSNVFEAICPVIKNHPILCGDNGIATIKQDIEEEELDSILVCACSGRVKWDIFQFGDAIPVERVNLREGCVWSYKDAKDGVKDNLQILAQDYVKMGVAKLKNVKVPEPEIPEICKTIMVVGGGFTGMTAALHAAKTGYEVVLIEKNGQLGGHMAEMYKTIPYAAPYTTATDTGIEKLIAEVQACDKITIYTNARLDALHGAPGLYEAVIHTSGGDKSHKIGSVVLATGWVEQDKAMLEPLGYGKFKNVVTAMDFERMAKNGGISRPLDNKPAVKVAFILNTKLTEPENLYAPVCEPAPEPAKDDKKDEPEVKQYVHKDLEGPQHLPISLGVNCLVALKQAGYVTEKSSDNIAYVFYDSMIVPGIHERYYKTAQDDAGVMLTKADIVSVSEDSDGSILIHAANTLFGGDIEVKVDLLVLPTGLVPSTAKDPVMNFVYRQGPQFPDLDLFQGYADSNYICFPYETRRTGVYAAGCVRQPMLMDQAEDDAAGAVLKAIQCISSANRGVAVHPRSGDLSYPVFNFIRCTQCKRCTEECPFGALDDDEKGTPKPNPTRCRRCGTCMGACPERVISFDTYGVGMMSEMIRQYSVPDDMKKGGPRVLILACENDAYPALDMAAFRGKKWSPYVRIMTVRCLGSINAIWIKDAMSRGTDGVMLLGCRYGDTYQCHFVKGSEISNRRKENIAETLKQLGIEPERVDQFEVAIDDYDTISQKIDSFMDMILAKGPNPFKGY